jgi:zinc/manganese transport system substrate-binding protein
MEPHAFEPGRGGSPSQCRELAPSAAISGTVAAARRGWLIVHVARSCRASPPFTWCFIVVCGRFSLFASVTVPSKLTGNGFGQGPGARTGERQVEASSKRQGGVGWLRRSAAVGAASLALPTGAAACGSSSTTGVSSSGVVSVVAAENEYGNVASQIGGSYVRVSSVESNPNTDPHAYELSPTVAGQVAGAGVVIQNGVGYDAFMNKIEAASPSGSRKVIDVQRLLGLPDSTPNPHLWYDPRTMPAVAKAIGDDLAAVDPAHASYFRANVATFDGSLQPWFEAIAAFKSRHAGIPAATTEPVADYLLDAMGIDNLTPFAFQADVMNGTDPTPQDVALEEGFFSKHMVKVFAYNQQVVDSLTESIRSSAENAGVPVVGVYETMPTPGYDYQSWMLAETESIQKAVDGGTSTLHL